MTSHTANPQILEVQVYHGADGSFTLVEDDCSGRRSAPVARTRFTYELADETGAVFRMELMGEAAGVIPADRTYQIVVFGVQEPETVQVQGAPESRWTYSSQNHSLRMDVSGPSLRQFEMRIGLADQSVMERDKYPQLFTLLQHAQIEYWLKDRIYHAVTRGRDTAAVLAELTEMQVGPALYGAVTELLTMNL